MRFRNTLAMGAVLLVLGGFVYFYEVRGREAREEAAAAAKRLLDFETEEVVGITLVTEEGSVAASKSDDDWRIVEPYALAADSSAIDGVINRLQSAEHDRLVVENAEDLDRFGFDQPQVIATLQLKDGTNLSLEVGSGTPVGYNVYVRRTEERDVYITAASLESSVAKKLFDLRDKRIFTYEDDEVARLEIHSADLDVSVRRSVEGEDDWEITSPIEGRADAGTVDGLITDLRLERAEAFVAEIPTDEELTEYGLDGPRTTITVWTADDTSQTLEVGGESEDPGGYYARRRGSEPVFVVSVDAIDELPEGLDDFRNRDILDIDRSRISSIEIEHGAGAFRLQKAGTGWRIAVPRSIDADASTVSMLLTNALNLRAEGFAAGTADDPGYGLASPNLTVALHLDPETEAEPPAEGTDQTDAAEAAAESTEAGTEGVEAGTEGVEAGTAGVEAGTEGVEAGIEPGAEARPPGDGETVRLIRVGNAVELEAEEEETAADEDPETEEGTAGEETEEDEAEAEPAMGRYVHASGDPAVYIVPEENIDNLRLDLLALRAKTLLQFSQADLTRIEIHSAGSSYAVEKQEDEWVLADGGELESTLVSDLLWNLNYLRMEDVTVEWDAPAAAPSLAEYGLEPPQHRVLAYIGGELVAEVNLGNAVPEGAMSDLPETAARAQVYATVGVQQAVYRIASRLSDAIDELVDGLGSS